MYIGPITVLKICHLSNILPKEGTIRIQEKDKQINSDVSFLFMKILHLCAVQTFGQFLQASAVFTYLPISYHILPELVTCIKPDTI